MAKTNDLSVGGRRGEISTAHLSETKHQLVGLINRMDPSGSFATFRHESWDPGIFIELVVSQSELAMIGITCSNEAHRRFCLAYLL